MTFELADVICVYLFLTWLRSWLRISCYIDMFSYDFILAVCTLYLDIMFVSQLLQLLTSNSVPTVCRVHASVPFMSCSSFDSCPSLRLSYPSFIFPLAPFEIR